MADGAALSGLNLPALPLHAKRLVIIIANVNGQLFAMILTRNTVVRIPVQAVAVQDLTAVVIIIRAVMLADVMMTPTIRMTEILIVQDAV